MSFKIKNHKLDTVLKSKGFTRITTESLPARFSYPLALLTKQLREAMDVIGDEQRKLAEKYCDRDDKEKLKRRQDGGYFFTERLDEFQPAFEELMNQETPISGNKIKVDLDALNSELEKPLTAMEIVELSLIIDFDFNGEGTPKKKKGK